MASPPRPARPRGRPRSADVDAAILDAAAALLGEVGYSAMSMDKIVFRSPEQRRRSIC